MIHWDIMSLRVLSEFFPCALFEFTHPAQFTDNCAPSESIGILIVHAGICLPDDVPNVTIKNELCEFAPLTLRVCLHELKCTFHDNVWNSVHFVISPKALGKPKRVTINPTWRAANTLKFLVCADPQSPYYDLPEEWERHLGEWTLDKYEPNLYISPIAEYVKEPHPADSLITGDTFDREATARNYARAAELIMKHGGIFKLSLQTHLFIGVQ
jgi:hypothetical protein